MIRPLNYFELFLFLGFTFYHAAWYNMHVVNNKPERENDETY
jgi:hypothetical protein